MDTFINLTSPLYRVYNLHDYSLNIFKEIKNFRKHDMISIANVYRSISSRMDFMTRLLSLAAKRLVRLLTR